MAETGLSLVVSKEMLANLQKADNAITNLATKSEQAKNRIVAAFTEMGQKGVGAFINKLHEAQSKIASVNGMKVQGVDFSQFTDSTTKAIDNVNQLATTITKFETISTRAQNNSKGGFNLFTQDNTIKAFEEELDSLWNKLADTSMKLLGLKREWYTQGASRSGFGEDIKNTTQEADKLMSQIQRMQTFLNGIKGQSAEAFGAMIKSMHQSDFELVQLNQSLRDGNSLLQKQTELWQQSYQAKNNSSKKQVGYEEQIRAYEQMFDKIIAKEEEQTRIANDKAKQRTEQAKQGYEEQLRAYEQMFDKIQQKEQKQDLDAYNAWLKQKDKERQVNEQIEDEKYKRQKDNAYKAYREEQERQSRLLEEYKKQNERARESVTTAPEAYRQTLKMYVQMFDEIDKKRQADILKASQAYDKIAQQVKQRTLEEERAAEQEALANKRKAEQVVKNYQDEVKAARKAYAERQRMYEELFAQQAKEQSKARRDNYERYISSYDGAMRLSGKANTLSKEERAIKALEQARANLSKTDSQYEQKLRNLNNAILKHRQNIDSATAGSKKLQDSHRGLMNISEQLQRRLALLFSVSQITGYISKLISVRGEFELQQRSLEAILQNKDEADKLWQQTIDLAVKSPFRVKELVTYTKQLAAYRVETEKLHNTTKMLSDVSAGLGVDMQRLILAFGQVKAANYLRGTELRQFSEAGINILGELAKYFSELEGIAVSVGDVFERVSKRMVSFADVEEIFKRITREGGIFYRMQEIQSETLKGQISNLKDSFDIMLNDIGKSNENTLKGVVSLFKSLVDNWRVVSAAILPVLEAMILRWGVFKLMTLSNSKAIVGFTSVFKTFGRHFGIVITQLTRGTRVAKAFTAATGVSIMSGWATVILAVAAALGVLVRAIQNATRVKKELDKLSISGAFDASRSIAEYKRLAEVVSDTSKTYDEQQKALTTLKDKYNDILPAHLLEEKTIKSLKGNYEEATNAINEYIIAKTKEKQIGVIQSEYGENVESQAKDLANDLKKALSKVAPNITTTDVLPIVNKLRELIQIGEVDTSNINSTLQELVKDYTGLTIGVGAWEKVVYGMGGVITSSTNNAQELYFSMQNLNNAIQEVTNSSLEWHQSFAYRDFNKIKEGYQAQSDAIGKYYETIRKYQKAWDKGSISPELERDYKFAINELNKIFVDSKQKAPIWGDIINEPFKLRQATIDANKALWQKMITEINDMPLDESKKGARSNFIELLEDDIKKLEGSAKQQEIAKISQSLADSMDVSLEDLDELFLKSDESISDYVKRVSSTLDVFKKNILQFDSDAKKGVNIGDYTKEKVDLMKKQVPFLEKYLTFFPSFLEGDKKQNEEQLKILNNRINLIKEMNKKYQKLNKTFDRTTSQAKIIESFSDTFKQAFEGTDISFTGLMIDNDKVAQLKQEGEKSGQIFSEEMQKKMDEVISSGTYIRSASESFKEALKGNEGFETQLYDDSTRKVIKDATDFANRVGTVTIGIGHAISGLEEATKYFGKTLSETEVLELFESDVKYHQDALNKVLDDYKELILTQEQYDVLLDRTYQGGAGAIRTALKYATNIDYALNHFTTLDGKLQRVGKTFDGVFGSDFINNFKNAQSVAERLALVLQTINLTTKATNGNIDPKLFNGMLSRSQKLAEQFSGDLNLAKLLEKASVNISEIDFTNIEGVVEALKRLVPIAKQEGKEAELALSKAISSLEAQIGLDVKIEDEKAFFDKIEEMFSGYELSIELQKLNIPKDWAKDFFGIDTFDLSEIRKELEDKLARGDFGTESAEELKKKLNKVEELEAKSQQERLKTYLQYARDAVGERAKIKLEEMRKLQEIEETFTKPEQQDVKQKAIAKVKADSQKDLNKLEWEEFQKSDTFTRLFSDLDSASSLLINHALEKLKEFKDEWKDMPLEDMRAIVSKIDELELALGKINPFKGLKVLKEQIKKAQQEAVFTDIEAQTFANNGDYAKAYEQELIFQQKRKQEADKQIADLETVIQLKEEGNKYDKVAINLNKNQQGLYNNSVESLKEMLATQEAISNDSQNQSDAMSANLAQIKAQVVYHQAQAEAINTAQDMANNLYDAFKGLNEVLGGGDSIGAMFADMGMQMLNTVFQTLALQAQLNAATVAAEGLGVALNSAMGVIGWIVMGVNLIVQGLTAVFNAKDKRLSNQIETLTHNVEDLDRALAKLEDRIDSAFSLTSVSLGTKDAIKNLQSQIYSYERMIKLEKDKKKTDTDAIRQYEQAIDDLKERQKELEKEAVSSATSGILDSTRDAARQFVDAWYDAFAETGDGLQGLKDNFKDIMLDMIQQQASMSIAGNFLNRWKAQLDKYINADDLELTTKEASNWMRSVQEELPMLNEALQNYFTAMEQAGLDLSKTGEMSGLQRGIQSVTEETAQALEALLNSTRFFVADSNAKLTLLVESFTNPESANPMLSELRSQTDLIRTIRDMFGSVIGRGDSTHSGAYLKVVM